MAVVDSKGSFRQFLDVLGDMAPALDKMTEAQRSAFLLKAFGREALGGVNAILTQVTNGIRTNTGETVKGAEAIAYLRKQFRGRGRHGGAVPREDARHLRRPETAPARFPGDARHRHGRAVRPGAQARGHGRRRRAQRAPASSSARMPAGVKKRLRRRSSWPPVRSSRSSARSSPPRPASRSLAIGLQGAGHQHRRHHGHAAPGYPDRRRRWRR
ncbi:MAG: hypothetical protein MZV63_31800 [Marinilabiliales bacterium]|nr:hypothetical protein [Marinilabiliales bacterium]